MEKVTYYVKRMFPEMLYPAYIRYKYWKKMGKKCNLLSPKTFTEKIQWAKLYRRNELLSTLSDKVQVRKWVANKIGDSYLVPRIGDIYYRADDIPFDQLPNEYVLKVNNGSGFNIIVDSNNQIDSDNVKKILNKWLTFDFFYSSFEYQYKGIRSSVYIEEKIKGNSNGDLPDYKFFCFYGKVFCSYTRINTYEGHDKGKIGFFDRDYNLMPYYRADYEPIVEQLPKPRNYLQMVKIAEKLSEGFSHVRVDLYNIDGKIYFGEMTFSTFSGYCRFVPEEFDRILGNQWDIHKGI